MTLKLCFELGDPASYFEADLFLLYLTLKGFISDMPLKILKNLIVLHQWYFYRKRWTSLLFISFFSEYCISFGINRDDDVFILQASLNKLLLLIINLNLLWFGRRI